MARPEYTPEQKKEKLDKTFNLIEKGSSLRKALKKVKLSPTTFYKWIDDESEEGVALMERYTRAHENRMFKLAGEILEIADDKDGDVNRDRLRVDTRKWLMSKLNPKKFGDSIKVDQTIRREQPLFGQDEPDGDIKAATTLPVLPVIEEKIKDESE